MKKRKIVSFSIILQSILGLHATGDGAMQLGKSSFALPYARGLAVILAQAEYAQKLTSCAVIQKPTEDDLHDIRAVLNGHFEELTRTKHDLLRPVIVKKAAHIQRACSMQSRAIAADIAKRNYSCKRMCTKNIEGQRAVAWLGQMKYMHTIDTDMEWPSITPQGFKALVEMIGRGKDTISCVDSVACDAAYLYKHYRTMVVKGNRYEEAVK